MKSHVFPGDKLIENDPELISWFFMPDKIFKI